MLFAILTILVSAPHVGSAGGIRHKMSGKYPFRLFYQKGISDVDLPTCKPWSVCSRVDTYSTPWMERQCQCPNEQLCSLTLDTNDGHTIVDKSRQFKICESISTLTRCRYFRDITWTYVTYPNGSSEQIMQCQCPLHGVPYISKHQLFQTPEGTGYRYLFACSPPSRLRCQRKEPCRLFTVKKRPHVEDVNTNTLCQCPHGFQCPQHHTDHNVISGTAYPRDQIRTYSGYCSRGKFP